MKLTDLISYLESKDVDDVVERLQYSYSIVVNKLRLSPALIPIVLTGQVKIPFLRETPWLIRGSQSEFKVKDTFGFKGVEYTDGDLDDDNGSDVIVGDIRIPLNDYSFENFEDVNESHTTVPKIIFKNGILKTDTENTFFLLECYPYPYPVKVIAGDPFLYEHTYTFESMIILYGVSGLEMDDLLGTFILLDVLRKFYKDNIRIADEGSFEFMIKEFYNTYNEDDNVMVPGYLSTAMKMTRMEL